MLHSHSRQSKWGPRTMRGIPIPTPDFLPFATLTTEWANAVQWPIRPITRRRWQAFCMGLYGSVTVPSGTAIQRLGIGQNDEIRAPGAFAIR
jgi:hypothetical protein